MKYAKGPWKAESDSWVRDSNGKLLASISQNFRTEEEVFATRDLITMAPEMMDTIIALISALAKIELPKTLSEEEVTAIGVAEAMALELIDRASGGEEVLT